MKTRGKVKPKHKKRLFPYSHTSQSSTTNEREELKRCTRKRRILFCGILLLVLIAAGIAITAFFKIREEENPGLPFGGTPEGNMPPSFSGNMTMASGVTNVGVTEETFGVENITAGLQIEEVYINSGDMVTEGTRILKLSETSVAEARDDLEQALTEADLAYRSGLIQYEQSKITAKYDLDCKILDGKQAKEIYDETLSGLQDSVDLAKEQLLQAQEKIAEYQSYVSDDSYRSYFRVDEYQAVYDETLDALKSKMDEWGISWSQVTRQGEGMHMEGASSGNGALANGDSITQEPIGTVSGGDSGSATQEPADIVSSKDAVQNATPSPDQIQVLSSLYGILEKQLKKLEQARNDYENALANAAFELQTLELQLPRLEQALTEAEKEYQSQVLQAKVTYEKTLVNADNAQSDYEAAIQQAEATYETLWNTQKEAQENLALFESSVGDGYFYASGDGTILRTMVRAGGNLTTESTVFMYSNPKEMTVTVSVGQENIADIGLEDSVYIQTDKYGGFEGIVEKVDPISDSDSRTNITYSVVVRFKSDAASIPANESVTVVFGMDEEAIQNAISMRNKSMPEGSSEGSPILEDGGPDKPEDPNIEVNVR